MKVLHLERTGILCRSAGWDPRQQRWIYGDLGVADISPSKGAPVVSMSLGLTHPSGDAPGLFHEAMGFYEPVGGYVPLSQRKPPRKVKVTIIIEEED